jgi:hypothetical protein
MHVRRKWNWSTEWEERTSTWRRFPPRWRALAAGDHEAAKGVVRCLERTMNIPSPMSFTARLVLHISHAMHTAQGLQIAHA